MPRCDMRSLRLLLAAAACAALPCVASSAEFSGQTTTFVRAFDVLHVELDPVVQRVVSYRPVDQYVRLSWDDVGKRSAWTVDVSLRGRTDLNSGKGDWQTDDADVLTAFAKWRSKKGLVGLTLGRQNAVTSFGWHAYDGIRLDFDKLPRLRVFVDAGLPVDLFDGGAPQADGFTWASGITGVFPKHGSIGVDYEIRRQDGDTLSEAAGFDLALRGGGTRLLANGDYSLLLDTFGETTLVVGRRIAKHHDLEARYTRVRPIFDSDSIFNAWTLNPYDEWRLQYEFRGDGPLGLGGYVSVEDYASAEIDPSVPATDPTDLPEDIRRAAVTARWETRHEGIHRDEAGWQRGWSGNRLALMHDSDWALNPRWRVGCGASLHRYENRYRLTGSDEVWSLRGRVRYDHDGKWDLGLEVEQYFGRDRDTLRASLVFGTRFGRARGALPWWGGRWTGALPATAPAIPHAATTAEPQEQQ